MYVYIYPYIHTYIHTYIYTYLHTFKQTYIHTNIHTYRVTLAVPPQYAAHLDLEKVKNVFPYGKKTIVVQVRAAK